MINDYLHGNFAPVSSQLNTSALEVTGTIPEWLDGAFIRNGSNPQFKPVGIYNRIDGDGMLHLVRLKNGQANYVNRFVETFGYQTEREAGKPVWRGFLEKPNPDAPASPRGGSIYKNTSNTSVVHHAGVTLSMYEGGLPHRVDPRTLETLGIHDFFGTWEGTFIAHCKVDQQTDEIIFISAHLPSGHYRYGRVGPDGRVCYEQQLELSRSSVMHDMAITANYAIIFDLPYTFDKTRLEKGMSPLGFEHDSSSRFGVMPREGGDIQWFECSAGYIFHTLNAFEIGDEIVLHAPKLKTTKWLNRKIPFGYDPEEVAGGDWAGQMTEWRFNLRTGHVSEQILSEWYCDFPQLPLSLVSRPHRYGYSARVADQTGKEPILFDGLIKHDFLKKRHDFFSFGPERYGHEVAVVPCLNSKVEDDCLLMTYLHDEFRSQSELVIYHGADIGNGPLARVHLPQRVPYGFHGTWLPHTAFDL